MSGTPALPQTGPFVLLDDARAEHPAAARLYRDPVEVLTAEDAEGLERLLARLDTAGGEGLHAAGWLAYEAGFALEPRLRPLLRPGQRLAWFGLFEGYVAIPSGDVPALLPPVEPGAALPGLGPVQPGRDAQGYAAAFAEVLAAIEAGDIYQANLTFPNGAAFAGDPLHLYSALRPRAGSGYGGIVRDGEQWLLSLSPELFFALKDGVVTVRPMKGTAPRGGDAAGDEAAREGLSASEKERAENLMIVDLMRNDLSRVAVPGSVRTERLFEIETYPTLHQMTSTVRADLAPGKNAIDILRAIFPCGSITGAPKIRAMELLHGIEGEPRGPYCGAIGRIDPPQDGRPGDAAFNVAIRTLQFLPREGKLRLGLGSAVVADSRAGAEWRECKAKGAFVGALAERFDLIETMGFDPASGIAHLERHLERMKASAAALGFAFDRHAARNALNALCFDLAAPCMIRLLLSPGGAIAIETRPKPEPAADPLVVAIRPLPVASGDFRLAHKTTARAFYDEARAEVRSEGADEVVFLDPEGRITEGSFTHVFVERDDMLLTPPLTRGLLPGVLRGALIEEGKAREADLVRADLEAGFLLGNALRGLMPAKLA